MDAVGGAALGSAFQELLKLVVETARRATRFKQSLDNLESLLKRIDPLVKEIEQKSNELGRPQNELEALLRKMEEGATLVRKCSTFGKFNIMDKISHRNQLEELKEWLNMYFTFDMQAQILRDIKEISNKVSAKPQSAYEDEQTQDTGTSSKQGSIMNQRTMVIGPEYCTSYPMTLVIVRTVKKLGFPDKFCVKNINNNIIFNLERPYFDQRFSLFDNKDTAIVTLQNKGMKTYPCWEVFKDESRQQNDLLFSVKKHMIQPKANLNVFLATNTKKTVCDFMVQGNEGSKSTGLYIVKDVQSNVIIAKISKYVAPRSFGFSKENAVVRLEANVDHAYIVVLIVIHMLICRQA